MATINSKTSMTSRRAVLLGAGGLGASVGLGYPIIRQAKAAEPVRIGMVLAKQGPIMDQAENLAQGVMLAMEERGNSVLGRPIELTWLDEPTAQSAQQNTQKLIDEQKVCAIIGGDLSATALAMAAVAKRNKIPFVCINAVARELTGKDCSRYTFRVQASAIVQTRALAPFIAKLGKRWYFLTASFAFGQDVLASSRESLKAIGGTEVGSDVVPFDTADYSSFILKIRQAKPDVVVGGISSGDLSNFLKQWGELGMKGKIPFAEIAVGDSDVYAIGKAATGTFTKCWYFNDPANAPEDKAFAANYTKKYNRPAADKSWLGWMGMRSLLDSIELAKDTQPEAIVEALEKWKIMDGQMPVFYRKFDHQMMHRVLVAEAKPEITDKWDYFNVLGSSPQNAEGLDAMYGSAAEIACSM
jgi:branched-chain amino acid transport system substrate-binding protein